MWWLSLDTLYAAGQRRHVESLAACARQFLQLMEKPDVDLIEGLSPAISISSCNTSSVRRRCQLFWGKVTVPSPSGDRCEIIGINGLPVAEEILSPFGDRNDRWVIVRRTAIPLKRNVFAALARSVQDDGSARIGHESTRTEAWKPK